MKKDLEMIYEEILGNSLLKVITQPIPLSPLKAIKTSEKESKDDVLKEISCCLSELEQIAQDSMYKSFRNKIEKCCTKIRECVKHL